MAREGGDWHALSYSNLESRWKEYSTILGDSEAFQIHLSGLPAIAAREQQGTVQQDLVDSEVYAWCG